MRAALVHREGGEPSEEGWPGTRIRVRAAVSGFGVIKRDVRGERVEELLSRTHIRRREFLRCGGCWWSEFSSDHQLIIITKKIRVR